jgi:hypothetical protein
MCGHDERSKEQMTDFLMFIGPWKTLFYGLAFGFVIGVFFSIWCDETTKDRKSR